MVNMTGSDTDDDVTAGYVGEVSGCLDGIVAGGSVVFGFFVGRLRFGFVVVENGGVVG